MISRFIHSVYSGPLLMPVMKYRISICLCVHKLFGSLHELPIIR